MRNVCVRLPDRAVLGAKDGGELHAFRVRE